jgi:HPt (histidine-containing phosphotransfer) domain-containing protein
MDEYLTKPFRGEDLLEVLRRVKKHAPTAIASETLTAPIASAPVTESLNMETLKSLEKSIGADNLSRLIASCIEHSAIAIANMQSALSDNDLATIQSENHVLKGISGSFGASELFKLCQSLELLCKTYTDSYQSSSTNNQEIAIAIQKIEDEYHQVRQALSMQEKS